MRTFFSNVTPAASFRPALSASSLANALLPSVDPATNSAYAAPVAASLVNGRVALPSTGGSLVCAEIPGPALGDRRYWNVAGNGVPPYAPQNNSVLGAAVPPSGGPGQRAEIGRATNWCQQYNPPFDGSSPLASRSFWTPVALVFLGMALLLLTRKRVSSS
jgi:hypothetical protein